MNNTSAAGAGLQFDVDDPLSPVGIPVVGQLTDVVFQGNVATVQGGGLATGSSFALLLTNLNFTGNSGAGAAASCLQQQRAVRGVTPKVCHVCSPQGRRHVDRRQ